MTKILHVSDLHFGRPAAAERLETLKAMIPTLEADAVAVSGDLTQRCTRGEFAQARAFLDEVGRVCPYVVIPGNHDIRWLGAVARNLGFAGLLRKKAHEHKYSRYRAYISEELSPSLEVPGAVISGLNTAHGVSRGSLTRRFRDLGVIGHVKNRDVENVRRAFDDADPDAARIVMMHHNPIKGESSGRHGLANTEPALQAFSALGTELILCGHDHQDAVHTVERGAHGLVISTAGTISNRVRGDRPSSFNLVETTADHLSITTYAWQPSGKAVDKAGGAFVPRKERSFSRRAGYNSPASIPEREEGANHVEPTDPRR